MQYLNNKNKMKILPFKNSGYKVRMMNSHIRRPWCAWFKYGNAYNSIMYNNVFQLCPSLSRLCQLRKRWMYKKTHLTYGIYHHYKSYKIQTTPISFVTISFQTIAHLPVFIFIHLTHAHTLQELRGSQIPTDLKYYS